MGRALHWESGDLSLNPGCALVPPFLGFLICKMRTARWVVLSPRFLSFSWQALLSRGSVEAVAAHRPSLPSGACQLMVMPVSPTSLIPTQMSAHGPSRKFRRRQGKVATEASMTLHSHWFSGLLRTLWYRMLGGPGGTDGSNGAGALPPGMMPWREGWAAEFPLGASSAVPSCVTSSLSILITPSTITVEWDLCSLSPLLPVCLMQSYTKDQWGSLNS